MFKLVVLFALAACTLAAVVPGPNKAPAAPSAGGPNDKKEAASGVRGVPLRQQESKPAADLKKKEDQKKAGADEAAHKATDKQQGLKDDKKSGDKKSGDKKGAEDKPGNPATVEAGKPVVENRRTNVRVGENQNQQKKPATVEAGGKGAGENKQQQQQQDKKNDALKSKPNEKKEKN